MGRSDLRAPALLRSTFDCLLGDRLQEGMMNEFTIKSVLAY